MNCLLRFPFLNIVLGMGLLFSMAWEIHQMSSLRMEEIGLKAESLRETSGSPCNTSGITSGHVCASAKSSFLMSFRVLSGLRERTSTNSCLGRFICRPAICDRWFMTLDVERLDTDVALCLRPCRDNRELHRHRNRAIRYLISLKPTVFQEKETFAIFLPVNLL
jgi:hypothetical protein